MKPKKLTKKTTSKRKNREVETKIIETERIPKQTEMKKQNRTEKNLKKLEPEPVQNVFFK